MFQTISEDNKSPESEELNFLNLNSLIFTEIYNVKKNSKNLCVIIELKLSR